MRRKPQRESPPHGRGPDRTLERPTWERSTYEPGELAHALLVGRVAGPETSHDRRNVSWKAERLIAGDPYLQFGISGLSGPQSGFDVPMVIRLMGDAAGFDPDPAIVDGPTNVDPWNVLAACEGAGDRLAVAAVRGERVLLATGHPAGLSRLYGAIGALLVAHGATLARPLEGFRWRDDGRRQEIRYLEGVAFTASWGSPQHTHSPEPMERMLGEETSALRLVVADHGFAGAAIERGIDTISIVDVNDPAPVVARALDRTEHVIAMDDNVRPESYWPCFQAMASRFPPAPTRGVESPANTSFGATPTHGS